MRERAKRTHWHSTIILWMWPILILQGCQGMGSGSNQFQAQTTGKNGQQVGINSTIKNSFKGAMYFTLNHDLYRLDGNLELKQLTHNIEVHDPAISPDGRSIAFISRSKNYTDLMIMSTSGGEIHTLLSGKGQYVANPNADAPESTAIWYAQPAWAADSQHLLILSDKQKADWDPNLVHYNAFILDLQIFELAINDPNPEHMQAVAYADIGDGGIQNPSYRPGHSDQVLYTNYKYDASGTQQEIQITLSNTNAIQSDKQMHPWQPTYHPGTYGDKKDPSIALTPEQANLENLQPAFSPDGNNILYIRREESGQMSLYIMPVVDGLTDNVNTTGVQTVTAADQDRLQAAYNQSSKLLTGQYINWPTWSPDGKQIIYYGYINQTFDVWIATLVKDARSGTFSIKPGSQIQLTNTQGQLDAESRICWVQ